MSRPEESRRQRPGLACSSAETSASSTGAVLGLGDWLAIPRAESTVSMESVTTSDGTAGRKRTAFPLVLSSSSESGKEAAG